MRTCTPVEYSETVLFDEDENTWIMCSRFRYGDHTVHLKQLPSSYPRRTNMAPLDHPTLDACRRRGWHVFEAIRRDSK